MRNKRPERDIVLQKYDEMASEYDQRWSFYVGATVRETIRRLPTKGVCSVLDVGCGTGALLEKVHSRYPDARLFGVDLSPKMLEVAQGKLGRSVELRASRAESLPFEDESVDVVVSTNVFHFLREPKKCLGEFSRVLKSGGTVVITDWCDDYFACRVWDFLLRCFDSAHFHTYGSRECQRLLQESLFGSPRVERYKINWFWGLMTAVGRKR